MGEKSPYPVCKTCGKPHRGTCANPEAGGYLSQKVGVIAHVDHRKTSLTAAIARVIADDPGAFVDTKSGGGSSAVERRPSKPTVEGSTPSPRSKKSTAARKDVQAGKRRGSSGAKGDPKQSGRAVAQLVETPVQPEVAGSSPASTAGNQAPPVDTTTRGTPRKRAPKGTFDRKAYQRQKAAERRARRKSDQPDNEVSE